MLRASVTVQRLRLSVVRHWLASVCLSHSSSFSSSSSPPALAMDLARCQLDPYLRTLTTRVVDCKPAKSSASTEGEKKKKSREEKKEAEHSYDVELEDTILYPEGGGQPTDHGELDSTRVVSVQKTANGRIVHSSPSAFTPGSQVTVTLDWTRRFDHMQQHTGQHLLSACLLSTLAAPTASWWLASHPSECYVDLESEALPSSAQLQEVQDRCNELIRAALPVTVHTFPSVSAALSDSSFVSRLPQHKVLAEELTGTVRVIEIDGVDMNPCGGTHLRRLSELQLLQLTRAEKVKGRARVYFLAGERAVRAGKEAMAAGRELSALLSSGMEGQAEMVRKMQAELRALLKANTRLQRELAERIAQQLLTSSSSSAQPALLLHHQPDSSASFLVSIADAFGALLPASASSSPLLLLTATEAAEGKDGAWLLYGDRAAELAADVAKAMEGKGGGKGRKIQGKAARVDKRADAVKLLHDKLAASSAQ